MPATQAGLSRRQTQPPGESGGGGGSGPSSFDDKGYPEGFWDQQPDLEECRGDSPPYPYREPRRSPPSAELQERVEQAAKDLDPCWAEWVSMLL